MFREVKSKVTLTIRKNLDFPAHVHDDIELVLVKKEGGTAYCDGKKYTLSENCFFQVFPNQVHHYSEFVQEEYNLLIIKPSELLKYNNDYTAGTPTHAVWQFTENGDDNTVYLMDLAVREFMRDGYSPIIEAYLTALFGKLLNRYEIEKSRISNDMVLQILQYCAAHYKEDISVGNVAEKLHISRNSISHLFSARLSVNFCDYINFLRLIDAVNMLKNKNHSISEISYLCGFPTIRTFNRAFLKRYGVSPSAYKKN
ncbi:MAG: helix-turn-helix domain-containing protein [Lachnospiraceae bacterium]|nr:helix-turn-helix domain-containing protein [Lachnospiraceae bacterium]